MLKRLKQKQPVGAIVNHVTGKLVLEWEEIVDLRTAVIVQNVGTGVVLLFLLRFQSFGNATYANSYLSRKNLFNTGITQIFSRSVKFVGADFSRDVSPLSYLHEKALFSPRSLFGLKALLHGLAVPFEP